MAAAVAAVLVLWAASAQAADPDSCKTVRFSDVGWTDITATTAVTSRVLRPRLRAEGRGAVGAGHLHVDEEQGHRRLPRQLDADHGGRPQALLEDKTVEVVARQSRRRRIHAGGADLRYDAGLKELRRHRQVQGQARRQDLRHRAGQRRQPADPRHDRQGQVRPRRLRAGRDRASRACWPRSQRAVERASKPIVFLGWEPHPMNTKFEMNYLDRRRRRVRAELRRRHRLHQRARRLRRGVPERRQAAQEPAFALPMENEMMGAILSTARSRARPPSDWLKANPAVLGARGSPASPPSTASRASPRSRRASGSERRCGREACGAARRSTDGEPSSTGVRVQAETAMDDWLTSHKIPLGTWVKTFVDLLNEHAAGLLRLHLARPRRDHRRPDRALLLVVPPLLLVALLAVGTWLLHRSSAARGPRRRSRCC